MNRKLVFTIVGTVVLTAAAAGGWHWWTTGRYIESTDNAYVRADISVIAPKVSGYVQKVMVQDNQWVKEGDLLVKIDASDIKTRVAEAKASVEAQKAAIAAKDRQITLQDSLINEARARVSSAKAELNRAQLDFVRIKKLAAKDFASKARFDTAAADLKKAKANLSQTQASLAASINQLALLQANKKEVFASLTQAKAHLQAAWLDLDNTNIRAPIAGVVGNRSIQTGQYVQPGSQLLSIVPLDDIYVVANFKETQIENMQRGQPVSLSLDAFPDITLRGRIESFAPASGSEFSLLPPQNASGNFTKIVQRVPVRISVLPNVNLRDRLRPGLSVIADVDTKGQPRGNKLAENAAGSPAFLMQ